MKFETVPINEVPLSAKQSATKGYRPMVLVVDDEEAIAETLAEILNRSGFTAVAAYDGPSAIQTALVMPPQLVITDVMLPGMTGIELGITVRRIFPDCKIILFSGQTSTTDLLLTANRAGHHFELLHKPVHPTDLIARVNANLKPQVQHRTPAAV